MSEPATCAWVFHAGALGDSVMIWPLLRSLVKRDTRVHFVADFAKAQLASAEIAGPAPIIPVDATRREFTKLWTGEPCAEPRYSVARVFNFLVDPSTEPGRRWLDGATSMFPGARITFVDAPGTESRDRAWREELAHDPSYGGCVSQRSKPEGPIVCHVGAGSISKRWPMDRWAELRSAMGADRVTLIAGEVEAERFTATESETFTQSGGRWISHLPQLAEVIRGASVFIGADTGPTHLSAQLGIPTIAIFGPTDPAIWAPIGPAVTVVSPPTPSSMTWPSIERVRVAAESVMESTARPSTSE